jgi:hypothetical protein
MPFLRANVIPVNPQIHANVMRPVFVLNFIFEPLFVHEKKQKQKIIILKPTDISAVQMLNFAASFCNMYTK